MTSGSARNVRALAKVFFGRLFETDVFSSSVAAASSVVWLVALVATPGVMFSGSQMFFWAHIRALGQRMRDPLIVDTAALRSQAFHLDFVMAVSALVTMMVWSSLTPDRRDAQVLGPLPITAREQALARLLAILKFFCLFLVAVSVPTALAFNFVALGADRVFDFPASVVAHIVAAMLAGGSVCFALVATQLLLAAAFGPRAVRFVTLPLQLAALAGMIAALASTEGFAAALLQEGSSTSVQWNPAAWFLGVYRWVSGDHRAVFGLLALRGALAGIAIIALTLLVYPLAYERCLRRVIDSEGRRTGATSRMWAGGFARLLRPLLRSPLQRGLAAYMLATLGRSHTHRFIIGSYAGIALLIAAAMASRLLGDSAAASPEYAWFAIPLGVTFWLVCGVRVAIMMPIEPAANWIFKLTEPLDKRRMVTTVVTVMAAVTSMPAAALSGGSAMLLGHTRLGLTVFLIVSLAGVCLIELLTLTLKTVPFTCTYLPGQLKLRVYWAPYLFLFLQFTFTIANWGLWALEGTRQAVQLAGVLAATWIALRVWHMARAQKIRSFVYDEQPPSLVTTMDVTTSLKRI